MQRRVLAFDYDGTIAEENRVPPDMQAALERLRAAGYVLFLATGRRVDELELGALAGLFTGIVWENGAVLEHCATNELFLPFGSLDARLVERLEATQIPLERGRAILATWTPHEPLVRQAIAEWGGDASVAHNKGALMILPAGAAKGAGLERLLGICGFSPRNLVCFGDGENDISLLTLGELGVAVADAVPALRDAADLVAPGTGPAGVLELLETHWLQGRAPDVPLRREPALLLGDDAAGQPFLIPAAALAGGNLGVFGESSSGKSFAAGLLIEGMHHAGYQVLVVDPEGDFRSLRTLPGVVLLEGDRVAPPSPELVSALMEAAAVSVVLDLCRYPRRSRAGYVAAVLDGIRSLRERRFRPHWIVLEEAQDFVSHSGGPVEAAVAPLLAGGGCAFISYRPDRLAESVLRELSGCLVTRLHEPEAVAAVRSLLGAPLEDAAAGVEAGEVLFCDRQSCQRVSVRRTARRVPHVRHLFKYFDTPLPAYKRFRFRTESGYLDIEAGSLAELLACLERVPDESIDYHQRRGDFAAWVAGSLGDDELAAHLHKLARRPLRVDVLRRALVQRVERRYEELAALR